MDETSVSLESILKPYPKPMVGKTVNLTCVYITHIGCRLIFRERLPLTPEEIPGAKTKANKQGTTTNILWDWDMERCIELIRSLLHEKGYKLDVSNMRVMYSKAYHTDSYSRQTGGTKRAGNSPVFLPYSSVRENITLELA